jgi:diaminohydroxyphosphoribosylaminopyrimidine deaminase/5-amino-6-(5-phosphoribosylamino)uracil reductase
VVSPLSDRIFLLAALAEAKKREGFCAPNPAVGAVLVYESSVVARGHHWAAGCDHAEVACFKNYQQPIGRQHTLYVSLEPCCHHGKTPPCTQAIIASGVGRVVFAHQDPNPQVAGKAWAILQAAGIQCELLPLAEVRAFYRAYDHWHTSGRAFLTAKLAVTLNGVYGRRGGALQITGQACQQLTHQARLRSSAILTTIKTVLADDPCLNVRLTESTVAKPVVVLDRQLQMPLSAKLWDCASQVVLLHGAQVDTRRYDSLVQRGARCVCLAPTEDECYWQVVATLLGQLGFYHVWAELGGVAFTSLWQAQAADAYWLYVSERLYRSSDALSLSDALLAQLMVEPRAEWQALAEDWALSLTLAP